MLPVNFFEAPLSYEFSIWIYLITAVLVVVLAVVYYFALIPLLSRYIETQMLVVLISTGIIGGIAAGWVYGILPILKDEFGE